MKRLSCWILSKIFPFKSEYSIFAVALEHQSRNQERNWYDLKWEEQKLNSEWR